MINGKESFFKNQDILFSDESVKKLIENKIINELLNEFIGIVKFMMYFI